MYTYITEQKAGSVSQVQCTRKQFLFSTTETVHLHRRTHKNYWKHSLSTLQHQTHRLFLCTAALEGEVTQLGQAVAAAKSEYESAAARLQELRQRLKECDREIGALAAEKANLTQQLTDLAVEKKKLQHKYGSCI